MSVIKTTYIGDLQTKIEHVQSGSYVTTDADARKVKNSFSSNELFVGTVAACILTVMEATAQQYHFSIGRAEALASRTMRNNPKTIDKIEINIYIDNSGLSQEQKDILAHAAYNCPVVLSLHDAIEKIFVFHYR
ncbi:OsmC family protein [Sphingobacterium corticibacter]|uniref:Osmotically inducible protein OsmC n=1 Tax=Sphingobacterium corticibacter TaxID=2171749 RepID=A0A2T8HL98_9SPHI|nr:OsmC family protein [Sphingobacterium corticibacter]PVH26196.1 hypothetical protein DC487_00810 [Sphingobacterium corticibacter]